MKILLAGDWQTPVYEEPARAALARLGHTVEPFAWHSYLHIPRRGARPGTPETPKIPETPAASTPSRLWGRIQNRLLRGPAVERLNRDLQAAVERLRPDLLFIYRGTHILPRTLRRIRAAHPGILLAGYNNDDPFASGHFPGLWRHFLRGLPEYDVMFAYRHHNLDDFRRHGVRRVELLRSWFVPELHRPLPSGEVTRYDCDVVFVGHYEADGRLELLEAVVRAGYHLRLFGHARQWNPVLARSRTLRHLIPVDLVWDDDYVRALNGARIALCFLSRINRDTYTRRCFEIPACGTLMLSEYTEDLAALFAPDREAAFFRSREELLAQLHRYLGDDRLRGQVAKAGHQRVVRDGHDVTSRMRNMLATITAVAPRAGFA
ncbi:MAG: glycosyltransferase [Nitrospirota bacterium]|nr:glycosyltransferase [Nitrospirota bacterium]